MILDEINLKTPERFNEINKISNKKLNDAVINATEKLKKISKEHDMEFPSTCSVGYRYDFGENNNWTCGMYTGCFWLAYELTGDEYFKNVAQRHLETYRKRLDNRIELADHDVGFVYVPSCVAAYKITGNEEARKTALEAAEYFYENCYSKEGKFIIRAFPLWESGQGCRTMMDSLMNASLLFWAGKETDNQKYLNAAYDHVKTTIKYLIRNDGSSFHHYQFDPETAKPVRGLTWQGYSDDSCWGRGESWGVYGLAIAFSYINDDEIKNTQQGVTRYMLNCLPSDNIPYWDYIFSEDSDEPRDSSCGLIAYCGIDEICRYLSDDNENKKIFKSAANQMLEAVIDNCTDNTDKDYDGLIKRVTHALPQKRAIEECAPYADFFYLEALQRALKPDFKKYW